MFKKLYFILKCVFVGSLLMIPSVNAQLAFTPGESYTFYCGSASSQAEIITCSPAWASVYKYVLSQKLTGESTVYLTKERDAAQVMEEYGAKLLFSEEVDGTVNYYCYSSLFCNQVEINNFSVNLHIAQNATQTAVGSPIIFGGF